ncbi:hypothetical protein BMETH_2251_0 [methanotrophic bacterial endosymbiont of Bathymodiolus sp.]|nr:hypothetical protein BMETH_2251_0 [methanotrophic bacterial endosymbiont of Bathymodiolus sp.]
MKTRNTPTGVGKTPSLCLSKSAVQKHPHGRGEDYCVTKQPH